jgi:CheY-specific phosphatase CheX
MTSTSERQFVESPGITEELQAMAAAAAKELLEGYMVPAKLLAEPWVETDEVLYSGVMGFIGEHIRGTCLLAAPTVTILASAPENARSRDWVGELANQLVGRLKSKLLARGTTIALTTPIVLSGVRLQPLPRSSALPSIVDTPSGRVLVWLEVEVASTFKLGSIQPLGVTEGDFIAF